MKKVFFILTNIIIVLQLYGQTVDNALLFSQNNYSATARSSAMGSSFGALGGDFSSLSINPAGLGIYRSGEFTITPGLNFVKSESGNLTGDETSFVLSNIGYVGSFNTNSEDWKYINYGIGYNTTNVFDQHISLQSLNNSISFLDSLSRWAINEGPPGDLYDFNTGLAHDVKLLSYNEDNDPSTIDYKTPLFVNDRVNQSKVILNDGIIGESLFAVAANYKDQLFLGATLGFNFIEYDRKLRYTETLVEGSDSDLEYFNYIEEYSYNAFGFNIKLGAIYRVSDFFRFGAAIHSPTFYYIEDDYAADMESKFSTVDDKGYNAYTSSSPLSEIDYDLQTPWKFIISGALIYPEKAIFNIDLELIDYSQSKYKNSSQNISFNGTPGSPEVNDNIKSDLDNVINFKFGSEVRVNGNISLRGGYGYFGNPYNNQSVENIDLSYNMFTAGVGFRHNNFFLDIAWQYFKIDDKLTLYSKGSLVSFNTNTTQIKTTFGWKF